MIGDTCMHDKCGTYAFLLFKAKLPEASKATYTQKCTLECKYKLIRSSLCAPCQPQTLSKRCCRDEM